ncbi:MAG: DNA polymerase III subunit delta [Lachnospiraceae bacterium]|nr:DNA polymerase III subunit delta [Lachnospiraceae bacterium]
MSMSVRDHIKSGQFKNAYLLYGDEDYLKVQYRDQLVDALLAGGDKMNLSKFEGKDINVGEVIDLAETMPFFAERRVIVIQDSEFFKSSNDEFAEYLKNIQETTSIVCIEQKVDKRNKAYKAIKEIGFVEEEVMPNEHILQTWIVGQAKREGKQITPDAWAEFLNRTGDNMDHMDREFKKLLSYCYESDTIEKEDVEAICTKQVETKIFDMINAIASKKLDVVMDLYQDMLSAKEPPMRILFMIVRQFNQIFIMKDMAAKGLSNREIATKMKMNDYIVRKNFAAANAFNTNQIRILLEEAADCEWRVKTGQLDERLAVEMLMIKYSR